MSLMSPPGRVNTFLYPAVTTFMDFKEVSLVLTYFNVRGRCEPILLMLEDEGVEYSFAEITLEGWKSLRINGGVEPSIFPYKALPTLNITHPQRGAITLAETNAILRFFDRAFHRIPGESMILDARVDMVLEASMFFLNRVFQLSVSEDWLAPPKRTALLENIIKPFLLCTEEALCGLHQELIPKPPDGIRGATAAIFTCLSFILSLFPGMKQKLGNEKEYQWCGALWEVIQSRDRVQRWMINSGVGRKPWTLSEFGRAEWIADHARMYDGNVEE